MIVCKQAMLIAQQIVLLNAFYSLRIDLRKRIANIKAMNDSNTVKKELVKTEIEKLNEWQLECQNVYAYDAKKSVITEKNQRFQIKHDLISKHSIASTYFYY